ncbi:FtsX-like permease family protein [Paraeggerthella sp.]|uniref:FtsX-like permease family protein n=1 Tax=Paraeggerthella sp. TaxID=2897350 RepID=UPI0035295717
MLVKLALGNVRKSVRDFGVYFLTVLLGVAVFYAFNSMSAQRGVLAFSESGDAMFELLGMIISGASVLVAFVLVFLVVYANRFLIKRRKREFGLYLALGMSTSDVVRIVLLESLAAGRGVPCGRPCPGRGDLTAFAAAHVAYVPSRCGRLRRVFLRVLRRRLHPGYCGVRGCFRSCGAAERALGVAYAACRPYEGGKACTRR